jgi:hypothetical protein
MSVMETRLAFINLDLLDKSNYSKKQRELSVCSRSHHIHEIAPAA